MTRETKIGLLVGLAFIIVVAILLTNHSTSTNDVGQANLSDAGANVRQSVATPVAEPAKTPVATRADLAAKNKPPVEAERPPVQLVQVGPAARSAEGSTDANAPLPAPPSPKSKSAGGKPSGDSALVTAFPNDLEPVGAHSDGAKPADGKNADSKAAGKQAVAAGKPGSAKSAPPVTPAKTYTAVEGDTVSRIASRQMGGNTQANRDALIKANPSLQSEGNVVHLGKSYVIPSAGATAQATTPAGSSGATASAAGTASRTTGEAKQVFKQPPPASQSTVLYTVKENDNLWRIAAKELGDGNLWQQIKELNRDVLKGSETVKPNMRIRLPKTATASAAE